MFEVRCFNFSTLVDNAEEQTNCFKTSLLQVLPIIWEDRVATLTSETALFQCVC